ncbi:MAG: Ig-like domain-containing protein [Planctomycetota bacterium]|nr:Ig-like domain-containing protein [Planctomycetota bacterium]
MSKFTLLFCVLLSFQQAPLPAHQPDEKPEVLIQTKRIDGSSIQIELRESSNSATFSVKGIRSLEQLQKLPKDDLQKLATIRVQKSLNASLPPLLGTVSFIDSELRFTSRFPLSPSVVYRVELSPILTDNRDASPVLFTAQPRKSSPQTTVVSVFPSADVLPENVLKFYIHFSASMSRGEAYQRVHLMRGNTEVLTPFLELGEELWDAEQRRFTLFVHPGRIKKGLKPREESGAPMVDGNEYVLRIDGDWLDAQQKPLREPFVKKFRVAAADAVQPEPKSWKIVPPTANSRASVKVRFDEPLDHSLLNRVIRVLDASKSEVAGTVSVSENEKVWSFEPKEPWTRGQYTLVIASTLEDLAGNNLARPFETEEREDNVIGAIESELSILFYVSGP